MIGKTVSHYQVLSRLGTGGMGEVYKAQDTRLERPVALKFLSPHVLGSSDGRQRFLREARAAASLSHPTICTVYEIDEIDGRVFIAMEFVQGQNLATRIRVGPVPVPEAVAIITQVAAGLQEAHRKGFVHRDIKPANLMVTPAGRAVILDFGLVRSLEASRLSSVDLMPGTTAYLSPEQVRCEVVDQRADIWAVGVVLYEMLAGERPFQGEIDQATLYQIVHEEPRPLSELVPAMPSNLMRVVTRALAKDPSTRYQLLDEMLDELRSPSADAGDVTLSHLVPATQRIPSIAVLPFTNLTGDPERDYLCDGMAEELINALTTVRGLKVIARTSSFAFKGRNADIRLIGKALGVASILEGSVRIEGDQVRITAQLIDTHDGGHLWSQRFDRELTDIFILQDEIALATVSFLKPKLRAREHVTLAKRHTEDIEAYQLYHKGYFFYNRGSKADFQMALKYFDAAIARDPGFAPAYWGAASVYGFSGNFGYAPHIETVPRAKRAVRRALELDDSLARAHSALGIFLLCYDWDWDGARCEIERAEALDPNPNFIRLGPASLYAMRGELKEAIAKIQAWMRIDPYSILDMTILIWLLIYADRKSEAREQIGTALEIAPHFDRLHWYLGVVNVLEGRHAEGIACMRRAVELSGRSSATVAGLAWALAAGSQEDEARALLAELNNRAETEYIRPYELIKIHLALEELDDAFACLDLAYVGRDDMIAFIRNDVTLRGLHQDPRWEAFIARMKFPSRRDQARGAS